MAGDGDESSGSVRSYHVAWFITDEVRRDVTVTLGEGRKPDIVPGRTRDAVELGSVALVEGLVNAHTHLEFSRLSEPFPATGCFTDWIRSVVQYRRENPGHAGDAIRAGVAESKKAGTTLLGEIATIGWSPQNYSESGFAGVVYQELLGLTPERLIQQTELARSHLAGIDTAPDRGLSPHAPYSTHPELVRAAVDVARRSGRPIAMHIAETRSELELLAQGTGEFRDLLTDFGLWNDELYRVPRRPMDFLKVLAEAPCVSIIHGNYLEEDELRFIAERPHMTMVYCPRTHAAFGHAPHPWRRLLDLGGRVAIGTDSRASNPDLSVFAELQFLASRHLEISHLDLLRMGSRCGRIALGVTENDDCNLTLIQLADPSSPDIEKTLFGPLNKVCGTMTDKYANKSQIVSDFRSPK